MTQSKPSKSARKREHLALQELGEQLIALSDAELATIMLEDALLDAITAARTIKSRGASRRQRQLIGKLMKDVDPAPIRAQLTRLRADDMRQKRLFARAEQWRDRFVQDPHTALDDFAVESGTQDDELRRLLADLESAFSDKDEKMVRRKIFRRVHEILVRIAP